MGRRFPNLPPIRPDRRRPWLNGAKPAAGGPPSSPSCHPRTGAPVVLRHVDGLSYPELAIALDRPEGTVKAQVHRGLALLRTAFEASERLEREEMTA